MKKLLLIFTLLTALAAHGAIVEPVKWTFDQRLTSPTEGVVTLTATIGSGWHVYALDVDPSIGPTPLSVKFTELKGAELVGTIKPDHAPHHQMDDMFEAELSWWTGSVTLTQRFKVTAPEYTIAGTVRFAACNDETCVPPANRTFTLTGTAPAPSGKEEPKPEPAAPAAEAPDTVAVTPAATDPFPADTIAAIQDADLWAPVTPADSDDTSTNAGSSLWIIFLACFLGGFVALLTPCVWPMIPLTVSFFLKRSDSRGKAVGSALTYGASIVIIYLILGLLVTGICGASSLNALSTNKWVNLIFFALLVIFAISFFGAFEITIPQSWANKMDANAQRTTGLLSIFFMAFTLTLVSFSCTGPIIGTLLVEAAGSDSLLGPAVGMLGFSLALAIPFCLFAMFPSMLSSLPRSGGWMNTVKVVLGFIELALSLKFLSVADLACGWRLLDREVFIVLWVIIFALLGLYLLGKFNFSHYGPADSSVGVTRFFLSMASLGFAVYLLPGLWGAPLKAVSAFVPPLYTQDFNLYGGVLQEYDDYEQGMAAAAREGRPVLLDFSGYGCVNCRKMEAAVLDNPDVRRCIEENFVVITLMVDDKKSLPSPVTVQENGRDVTLDTYGDYWSYLQRYKFNANAQPYYVTLDAQGRLISGPFVYKEDIPAFLSFLSAALK